MIYIRHKREESSELYLRMVLFDVEKGKKWQGRVQEAGEFSGAGPKSNASEEINEDKGGYCKRPIEASPLCAQNSTPKKNF